MDAIRLFRGEYRFLSNFYPCSVQFEGEIYPSVEHAYQAAKTLSPATRYHIQHASTPGAAKRLGRANTLRPGWAAMRVGIMRGLLVQKFSDSTLMQRLLATGNASLEEGNTWGDKFWGTVDGVGTNMLGKCLMGVRVQLNREESA